MDIWLMISLAIVGIVDINLERYTGRGLIARVEDWVRGA